MIQKVVLSKQLESIDGCAFVDCSSLDAIIIPESVTTIGESAFQSCTSLSTITIPENIESIGRMCFHNCEKLTSVTYKGTVYTSRTELITVLEENEVEVGDDAFWVTGLSD